MITQHYYDRDRTNCCTYIAVLSFAGIPAISVSSTLCTLSLGQVAVTPYLGVVWIGWYRSVFSGMAIISHSSSEEHKSMTSGSPTGDGFAAGVTDAGIPWREGRRTGTLAGGRWSVPCTGLHWISVPRISGRWTVVPGTGERSMGDNILCTFTGFWLESTKVGSRLLGTPARGGRLLKAAYIAGIWSLMLKGMNRVAMTGAGVGAGTGAGTGARTGLGGSRILWFGNSSAMKSFILRRLIVEFPGRAGSLLTTVFAGLQSRSKRLDSRSRPTNENTLFFTLVFEPLRTSLKTLPV